MKNLTTILFILFALAAFTGCRVRLIEATTPQYTTAPPTAAETEPEVETTTTAPPTEPETQPTTTPTEPPTEPETQPTTPPSTTAPTEPPTEPETQPTTPPPTTAPPEATAETTLPALTAEEPSPQGYSPSTNQTITIAELPTIPPTITMETPSPAPGETTLDDDGEGTLGLIIDRHTGILNSGLGSLFSCQRLYVYFENGQPFQTVNRNDLAHRLIIDSGGYNVAARRGNDALLVYQEWVQRRNPYVIIKAVPSHVLGANVTSTAQAEAARQEILTRPGFEALTAVINRRVLLISQELFATEEGQLLAKLHIAHAMYPSLFGDIHFGEVTQEILDSGGQDFTRGIFAF